MTHTISWYNKFLIINMVVAAIACGEPPKPPAPPPVAVGAMVPTVGSTVFFDKYPANVNALEQVDLKPQVNGYISAIHFKDGEEVEKGRLLYSIDDQAYQSAYDQAEAALALAKANLAKTKGDADRYAGLARQEAVSKEVLEHALADLQSGKAAVEAAKATVALARTNLKYAGIRAPFSGTIGISSVRVGASVQAGATLLNTIGTTDPIAVDFPLDEKEIPRFSQLLKNPRGQDSLFTLLLPDGSMYAATGKFLLMDRAIDAQTATVKVRLVFPNPGRTLRQGMGCTVKVRHRSEGEQILVPTKALVEQMGEYFVYAVGDSSKAVQKKVTVGQTIGNKTVILEGIQPTDSLITDGVQRVKDGVKVKASPVAKP